MDDVLKLVHAIELILIGGGIAIIAWSVFQLFQARAQRQTGDGSEWWAILAGSFIAAFGFAGTITRFVQSLMGAFQ
ncbi:MAG: hypothetical protein E7001_00485 [Coriobacteriaceae bacterium]|nr:hypothetical protein [Coriobacteriaceae bacterium]